MNEKEFFEKYQKRQKNITVSKEVKRRVLATHEGTIKRTNDMQTRKSVGGTRKTPRHRWCIAAAACVLATALVFGLLPTINGGGDGETSEIPGFTIRAYATEADTFIESDSDGNIYFNRDGTAGFLADDYSNAGFFTGCLFRVEGEGIVRIQANISTGELYRLTYNEFVKSDDPNRWDEALNWKQTKRGSGTYYSAYDYVAPMWSGTPENRNDPDKTVQVRLSKRLGATIDRPYSENSYFELWTNEPIGNSGNPFERPIP